MFMKMTENHELIKALKAGSIAVIRTDTLYGLVACAAVESAVERL